MAADVKRGKAQFRYVPGMPMGRRIALIGVFVLAGLILQMTVSVVLGWVFLLAGVMLGAVRSRSTKPAVPSSGEWKTTTIEEIEDIEKLSRDIGKWKARTGMAGPGCGLLFLGLLVIAASTVIVAITVDAGLGVGGGLFRPLLRGGRFYPVWALDSLTVLFFIWLSGRIVAWEPPMLSTKARYLLRIYGKMKSWPEIEFQPSLNVAVKDDRFVPLDCRLLLRFKDGPPEFIGVQVQISLNDVQGTKYPYCYCVLIAKKEFGLASKVTPLLAPPQQEGLLRSLFKTSNDRKEMAFSRFGHCIAEVDSESDVDVVVVRQVTIGQGYHTTEHQALAVFECAMRLALAVVKGRAAGLAQTA